MLLVGACPSPRRPLQPVGAVTLAIGRDGASLRGVATDGARTYAALTTATTTIIEARRAEAIAWTATLPGEGGPIAATSAGIVVAALGGTSAAGLPLRGDPGAVVVAFDAVTGAERWKLAIDASEWATIAALASIDVGGGSGAGVVVAGSFAGTLRAGTTTVSSGGKADGFVARLAANGSVVWLVRMGGVGVDGISGVATAAGGDRIAIAGTFAAGADLLGAPLEAFAPKTPRADGFVAELDGRGARRWSQSFGGKLDDSVAGVAIDAAGRVAVATSARQITRVGATEIVAMGDADGVVAWWSKDGVPGPAIQLGGPEFDGVRAIAAVGNHVVVGGFFSGTIRLDHRTLTAGGGDDAYLAAFDHGAITAVWPVTGEGREEIAALAAMPAETARGFVAGVSYTARVEIEGARLPAPADPLAGAALVIRPVDN